MNPMPPPDPEVEALRLGAELQKTLLRFATEQAPLLRAACGVPAHVENLQGVVTCAFLGHCIELLRASQGTVATERLVFTMLEKLEQAAVLSSKTEEARQ